MQIDWERTDKTVVKTGKRISLLCLLFSLTLIIFAAQGLAENDNLLVNGDFSILDEDGLPAGWFTDAYRIEPGFSMFSVIKEADGDSAVSIQNITKNDARFAQTVQVKPETMYCLSGLIRAEGISEGHGANLSIEGIYAFSEKIYDTDGEWQKVEYYGETGPDQYEITVFVRLGGYSGESKGSAAFKHISLIEAEETPKGILADLWYKADDSYVDDRADDPDMGLSDDSPGNAPAWPLLIAIGLLYSLIVISVVYYFRDGNYNLKAPESEHNIRIFPFMLLALGLRMVLCFFIEGAIFFKESSDLLFVVNML